MQTIFYVTGLGLQIDKVMIMPGSELRLNAPAPGHWSRFGTTDIKEAEEAMRPKGMVVATPAAATDEPTAADAMSDEDLKTALEAAGVAVDGRWGRAKMIEVYETDVAAKADET